MKKFFLIATAIYLLFLALLGVITCIFGFIAFYINADSLLSSFSILIIYIPFIGWLIATGIGLLLKKVWARFSILIMSGFAIFIGVIFSLTFGLMPFPESANVNDSFTSMMRTAFIILSAIFLIALPIVYFIFFTRPTVKELFGVNEKTNITLERPNGISLLAFLYLAGAIFSIFYAIFPMNPAMPLFGSILISGWFMRVYQLFTGIVGLFIAYGFWKKLKAAWICFIIFSVYGIITGLINCFTFNAAVMQKIMPQNTPYPINPVFAKISAIAGLIVSIGFLVYVISKKALFFQKKSDPRDQLQPDESQ